MNWIKFTPEKLHHYPAFFYRRSALNHLHSFQHHDSTSGDRNCLSNNPRRADLNTHVPAGPQLLVGAKIATLGACILLA